MKRFRSSDDLESSGDKVVVKDWVRREDDSGSQRSSSSSFHRNSSYYKGNDSGRKVVSSSTTTSSRYDRAEDDRESSRVVKKRSDYDPESYDRRKSHDRHREVSERGVLGSSPRAGYGMDRTYRSESFSGPRRDFPKGFRSERDRPKRDGVATSWRRFGKDGDDGTKSGNEGSRGSRVDLEDVSKAKSPDVSNAKSPDFSKAKSPGVSKAKSPDVIKAKSPDVSKAKSSVVNKAKSLNVSKAKSLDVSKAKSPEVSKAKSPDVSKAKSPDVSKAKSPQGFRDVKSPGWSKDSGSEQSRSVETKKYEDIPVESGGTSSEPEEGELEPDPQPPVPSTKPVKDEVKPNPFGKEPISEYHVNIKGWQGEASRFSVEKSDATKVGICQEQAEGLSEDIQDVPNEDQDFPDSKDASVEGSNGCGDEKDTNGENEGDNNVLEGRREGCPEEDATAAFDDKLSSEQKQSEEKGVNLDTRADDTDMTKNVENTDTSEMPSTEKMTQSLKDKGKCIAVLSDSGDFRETNWEVENRQRDLTTSENVEIEGPSTVGFQFFSTDPIKKQEKVEQSNHNKPKDDKLALELSLSLPNVLLPIGSQSRVQAPGSPSRARSFQSYASSFRTNSDGFTASMSFSGSQQFTHNPSCSLTHSVYDHEQSVGSKPLFQGVDWKALALDENNNKEIPPFQGIPLRENGLHQQSSMSLGNSNVKITGETSKPSIGLDKQLSFNRPEYSKDKRGAITERDTGGLQRSNIPDWKEKALVVGPDFAESILTMIVSEPLHTMTRRFNDMTEQQIACVKEFVRDIISNPSKQWQLSALQKALRKRPDVALDMLINAQRTQLEILVALKTGLREFLLDKYETPSSDLAEIYLNMRCKNLNCRSLLPVDECDCKICAHRKDFCRECMCLVCSKFDMASNTCSWVGCDVCLHWCHADCGLRESYIRNGRSTTGGKGTTEMQFYCVACDHPSEMYGFVKEVFQNFVKEWKAENLSRELEYVRRLFCASEDIRGKRLHEVAINMLSKLASRADLQEMQNRILSFFTDLRKEKLANGENDSHRPGNISTESRKELPTNNEEGSNGIARSSQCVGWMKSIYPDKPPHLENSVSVLPRFDNNRNDEYTMNVDLRKNAKKEPIFDELESIVRIKLAESEMFQSRADEARKEGEALKRISVTKSEKIEEEYANRITKLRLAEAEEMRKQKVEELQTLERAYQEYFNMKMRMETDIKDLLLKMDATRRNLTT